MIEVQHFSYQYGTHKAVDDISFTVGDGEIVALIGPNGAGKSTTMKALTTLQRPCAGTIKIAGFDTIAEPVQARRHLGYLPENNPLYDDMIVLDALRFVAAQREIKRADRDECIHNVARQCGLLRNLRI